MNADNFVNSSLFMKISIITVVFNGEKYIKDCIESVLSQTFSNLEYIIIDGGSTDKTIEIIKSFKNEAINFYTGKDKGMYDALNKGIKIASGEVIGFLHADDMYASPTVVAEIGAVFMSRNADAVYGDLNYVDPQTKKVIRKWISKPYQIRDLELGWMPAHPTLYIKKDVYDKIGGYSLEFGTAADYELMLRLLYSFKIRAYYLPMLIVNMRTGGMSNVGIQSRISAFWNDYKALKEHRVPFAFFVTISKKIKKIIQYF